MASITVDIPFNELALVKDPDTYVAGRLIMHGIPAAVDSRGRLMVRHGKLDLAVGDGVYAYTWSDDNENT